MELYNICEHVGIFKVEKEVYRPLIPFLYELRDMESESDGRSNVNGWQKNDLHHLDEMGPLKDVLMTNFDLYISKIHEMYYMSENEEDTPRWSISMDNMFANLNGPGSFHVLHNHSGCNYSGVVYLQTPDQGQSCGNFYLQAPFRSPWMGSMQAETTQDYYNSFESQEGLALIFPAYMLHYVGPNMTDGDRIAVSFNMTAYFNQELASILEES